MGLLAEDLQLVMDSCVVTRQRVLELGNQHVYIATKPFTDYPDSCLNPSMQGGLPAKKLWLSLGASDYVSVDLNGQDGAVKADLAQPIPDEFVSWADIVTDFGTSEHVRDLYAAHAWAWNACRPGGHIVHVVPEIGSWPEHCPWYRSIEFFQALFVALDHGATRCRVERRFALGNSVDGWNVVCAVRRAASGTPFITREQFNALPGVVLVDTQVNRAQTWEKHQQEKA